MITESAGKTHWNYFLALERDLEVVSRYVEFSTSNFSVFSIELAHLLFAAASEVDVIAKLVCAQLLPEHRRDNIDDYKAILVPGVPDLLDTCVFVPRYGLRFKPWVNWSGTENPVWWRAYNKVKHERDAHFNMATLQNALNALGALLILCCHYYSRKLSDIPAQPLPLRETTRQLEPESVLLRLDEANYYSHLIV